MAAEIIDLTPDIIGGQGVFAQAILRLKPDHYRDDPNWDRSLNAARWPEPQLAHDLRYKRG